MAKERILVVESNDETCCAICDNMWKEYDIDIAPSIDKALELMKDRPYSVVITEIDIQGHKKIEVLRQLKENRAALPVLVVTTHNSVPLAIEAMKIGALGYITKPFNIDELKMAILHASEWHRLVDDSKEKMIFQEMALVDGLTQIYNRRYFDELLRREVGRAARYPQQFSLITMDIDGFKEYNDTHGHPAGDELLKKLAKFLAQICRGTDSVARVGGEEFSVIAPHTDKKSASVLATRLVLLAANEKFGSSGESNVTISAGVATFGDDAKSGEELIDHADKALYQAKKLGKNRVCIYLNN